MFSKETGQLLKEVMEIIHNEVLCKNGSFTRRRLYIKGWGHKIPDSKEIKGFTGKETIVEMDFITPLFTFYVKP